MSLELCLGISLRGSFRCQDLGICGSLCSRILHQLLVVGLGILLLCLSFRHLFCQILNQQVNHGNHPSFLLGLAGVCTPCCWGGCWGILLLVHRHLRKNFDASSCDTSWCRCCDQ